MSRTGSTAKHSCGKRLVNGTTGRGRFNRHPCFEMLEQRQLLSVTLPTLPNVTAATGTAYYLPLPGDSTNAIDYSVTLSDYSKLTASVTPATNKTLQFNVNIGGVNKTMEFELLDNLAPETTAAIEALVNSGFYNGLQIYRNGKSGNTPFVIQGGNNPPTGTIKTPQPASMTEEFDPNLQFTSAGLLAMARSSAPGTSSTEFFITETAARFLDYNYTIFGVQTSGSDVLSTIAAMQNQSSTQDPNGLGYLVTPITITSASIITNNNDGVLQLRVPDGVTGSVTVTVSADDGTASPATRSFTVTIQADSSSNPVNPFDLVTPSRPSSLAFLPSSGTNTQATNHNNSLADSKLSFIVSGVTVGNIVQILADGNVIGQLVADATTVTVPTDGSTGLTDGVHTFTAIQIAQDKTVNITESGSSTPRTETAGVPSLNSAAVSLTIDSTAPQFNFTEVTTAVVGVPYTSQVAVAAGGTAVTYQLTQAPTGMQIGSTTGLLSWTAAAGQSGANAITVKATDAVGNTSQAQFTINVLAANTAPVLTPATPVMGSTDEDTITIGINLSSFIRSATGTGITDADAGAVLGGIAVIGANGAGWEYSLNGSTFTALGTVSGASALLLPSNAALRYKPAGQNGETPTITYRAWDTTGGATGSRVNLSAAEAVGGSTAYSSATDTATLTVAAVNDAPVITAANPSLGTINTSAATTIDVATFINAGTGTTGVSDVDTNKVLGGIALTGTSGAGWAYSLNGTTFTDVGTVSNTSALLLPANAKLRYTPGSGSEAATITYRAWDTTAGTADSKVSTSSNGGITAFSAATDTARLNIAASVVSGHVYYDANNNGQRVYSEAGMAGVSVRLTPPSGAARWTQTDSAGYYSFGDLTAGTYTIQVFASSNVAVPPRHAPSASHRWSAKRRPRFRRHRTQGGNGIVATVPRFDPTDEYGH